MENKNLELWRKVERTNPSYTKKAKVGGIEITSIAPQFQILNATEQFGTYGETWGFRSIELDYSLTNLPHMVDIMEGKFPNLQKVGEKQSILGLVVFKAIFFHPTGEFPIINSISIFTDNARTKIDDNFAKKVETDALTKALSKLGFNADIFLGKFDDSRYFEENKNFFESEKQEEERQRYIDSTNEIIDNCKDMTELSQVWTNIPQDWKAIFNDSKENKKLELSKK